MTGAVEVRSTGSHCGGHASEWLPSSSFVMCGTKAAQNAAATPMRMRARKLEASFLACRSRLGNLGAGDVTGQERVVSNSGWAFLPN